MQMQRKRRFYEKYIKRILDITFSVLAILFFWWFYLILALLVMVKMGRPVIFKQYRPGMFDQATGTEKMFPVFKFRTMTDQRDERGNILPDEERLTRFGRLMRSTSLDELPEVFNILRGDMSIVGPRPQLVRDMVFMDDKIRMRHTAKPGLSGLAQVMGRNAISWEEKFEWDLKYIENVSFKNDLKILCLTVGKVFRPKSVEEAETEVTYDYGDAMLKQGLITDNEYRLKHELARQILEETNGRISK